MKKRATGSNKFPMQAFHQPFEVNLWGQSTIITFSENVMTKYQ
jgi:hypothetical protein